MKKILLVVNGNNYSTELADFAIKIARRGNDLLHAVFVSPVAHQMVHYPFPSDLPLAAAEVVGTEDMRNSYRELIKANMKLFKDSCVNKNISYLIDPDIDITIDELIDHSAFSDLIICSAKEEFGAYSFRDLLSDTHCPVMLVPDEANMPQTAILCYDESFSSIYAIKMYSYLFPEWKDLPTFVLSINPKGDNGNKFDDYLSDWIPQHFPNLQRHALEGNLQRELLSFIRQDDKHSIVVMGAFGRNAISRLFHRSLANVVLEDTSASLFIIHE